jgi:hypothetical protein
MSEGSRRLSREETLPLSLSAEEMDLLLTLAAPIDPRQRNQFLVEATAALEASAERTRVGPGPGVAHRIARMVQRRFFDPPALDEEPHHRRPRGGSHA